METATKEFDRQLTQVLVGAKIVSIFANKVADQMITPRIRLVCGLRNWTQPKSLDASPYYRRRLAIKHH